MITDLDFGVGHDDAGPAFKAIAAFYKDMAPYFHRCSPARRGRGILATPDTPMGSGALPLIESQKWLQELDIATAL